MDTFEQFIALLVRTGEGLCGGVRIKESRRAAPLRRSDGV